MQSSLNQGACPCEGAPAPGALIVGGTGDRISAIKRNLLHDVLKYNQQLAQHKSQQLRESRRRDKELMEQLLAAEQEKVKMQQEINARHRN